MAFEIRTREAVAGSTASTVYELVQAGGPVRAEIWPAFGFNCLRWQVPRTDGTPGDLLYCDPGWEQNPVGTRSGHPILFPFPNRMKHGRFPFNGRDYQLPLNETSGLHAIHGITPKTPWRVIDQSSGGDFARLVGEFQLSVDRPDWLAFWPGDLAIRVEYRLTAELLSLHAVVRNPGPAPTPWGLGFHPYFTCPNAPGTTVDDMILACPQTGLWEMDGAFPTGKVLPLPAAMDFQRAKMVGPQQLDTLFDIDVKACEPFATLGHRTKPGVLTIEASELFRELLLFTPPHRQALAIEPYTCTTDAANLNAAGIDSGWRVLDAGGAVESELRYCWDANSRGS